VLYSYASVVKQTTTTNEKRKTPVCRQAGKTKNSPSPTNLFFIYIHGTITVSIRTSEPLELVNPWNLTK
jgi:hypothetical protein